MVSSIRREAAHGLLQALRFECTGAQCLERLGHAAEFIGTHRRGHRCLEIPLTEARDRRRQDLHRARQPALHVDQGKSAESHYGGEIYSRDQ
jgi:hypothetical protein